MRERARRRPERHYCGLSFDEIDAALRRVRIVKVYVQGTYKLASMMAMVDEEPEWGWNAGEGAFRWGSETIVAPAWTCVTQGDFEALVVTNVAIATRKENV